MEHKAFLFDFDGFSKELKPILESALATGGCDQLREFISSNLGAMSDPYEGEPLDLDWESMVETPDAHNFGDFALTKYYSPVEDVGLGHDWAAAQEELGGVVEKGRSPLLGSPLESGQETFDPGKMGSYFQSAETVAINLRELERLRMGLGAICDASMGMLRLAAEAKMGLYVTF